MQPGAVQALIPKVRHFEKRLSDYGWKNGRCWIKYKLSRPMIDTGVVGVPSGLRRIVGGSYVLKSHNGDVVGRFVAKESSAWGLGPFFRRHGGEPGDYLILDIDLARHEAFITMGDELEFNETYIEQGMQEGRLS